MGYRSVTTDRLRRLLLDRLPPRLLDVRSSAEFAHHHLPGALNIPLEELSRRAGEVDPMVDIFVLSEHGIRSLQGCEWLGKHGYPKVVNVIGGMSEFGLRSA